MASKKPLKGFTAPWIDRSWDKSIDNSWYVDNTRKRREAKAVGMYPAIVGGRFTARQMGVAKARLSFTGGLTSSEQFIIYVHSQVSDSAYHTGGPALYAFLDREETEKLVSALLQALTHKS